MPIAAALALALLAQAPPQDPEAPFPLAELDFRCVGPTRGGRSTAVAGAAQRPGEFWFGASGGGVWKTTDFGQSWRCASDGFLANGSIGAIRVAPSDPDVVWVGTGSDGLRSNVIRGCGVYRSTDAGATWQFVGLSDSGHVGAIEVDPADPDRAFVAAIGNAFGPNEERGLFRTEDGGARWEKVLFVSPDTGVCDVELHPAHPLIVYACAWQARRRPWTILSGGEEGGVYRSLDGGDTWRRLGGGLPDGLVGKADLAVSRADPDRVYVLIEAPGERGGVYRSDDRGDTWRLVSTQRDLRDRPFYYTNIDADPSDADRVFVSATAFHVSADGGESWRRGRTPHGDHHDLWIHPERPDVMIQGNDGGACVTLDGGETWSTQHNQPTAELYQVAVDDAFPYRLYAGQQDNSTIRVPSLPPRRPAGGPTAFWEAVGGCETGPAIPKPGQPDVVYASCKGKFGVFDLRTGQERSYWVGAADMYGHDPKDLRYRFQRVAPIHVSPHDPDVVYHGSQFVHRTRDGGETWETISPDLTAFDPATQGVSGGPITRDITGEEFYSCLYALAESPLQPGVIWAGSNDGPIHVTTDGGARWTDVTPAGLPRGGRVQCIAPSPHAAGRAFVAVYRYLLDDWRPYAYRTDDFGANWRLLTPSDNGIGGGTPTRVIREDPEREDLLYCGTEHGLFVSFDGGAGWQSMQLDLPATPVTDLVVHRGDLVLSTMGRSFWILDDLSPLRQWRDELRSAALHLFAPRTAVRMHHRASRSVPEYPGPGVAIDYWLAAGVEGLALEIHDGDGRLVRRLDGRAVPATAGHHRVVWDLRHSGRRGVLAAPGVYTVRAGGRGLTAGRALGVTLDPRVTAAGITAADVTAQVALQLEVDAVLAQARELERELGKRIDAATDPAEKAALEARRARLATADGPYPQPMLIDQLRYLAGMLAGADQRPGRDAVERLAALRAELAALGD